MNIIRHPATTQAPHPGNTRSHRLLLPALIALGLAGPCWAQATTQHDASMHDDASVQTQTQTTADASTGDYFQADGNNDGSDRAMADGHGAIAIGALSFARGTASSAIGYGSQAFGNQSLALGPLSAVYADNGVALGPLAVTTADYGMAMGYGSHASGESSLAIGSYAQVPDHSGHQLVDMVTGADGYAAVAIGPGAYAATDYSIAAGAGAAAIGGQAVAYGLQAQALGNASMALGAYSTADGLFATAAGYKAMAFGENATAFGKNSQARGDASTAFGSDAIAGDMNDDVLGATALGSVAVAWGDASVAVGFHAMATRDGAVAIGNLSDGSGMNSVAVGIQASSYGGTGSIAIGPYAHTGGTRPYNPEPGDGDEPCWICVASASDHMSETADYAIAMGRQAQAFGTGSIAIGDHALVLGEGSVAIGANSLAIRDNVISVGASEASLRRDNTTPEPITRQIVNVAAGTEDHDAVNVAQLKATGLIDGDGNALTAIAYDNDSQRGRVTLGGAHGTVIANLAAGTADGQAINVEQFRSLAATIGGGISMGPNGLIGTPSFGIQGSSYFNVGDAFAAVDEALNAAVGDIASLDGRVDALEHGKGKNKGSGHHGRGHDGGSHRSHAVASNAGTPTPVERVSGTNAVAAPAHAVATAGTSPQRRVANVAAGSAATDAANVSQVDQALDTAKTYADAGDHVTLNKAKAYADQKFGNLVNSTDFDNFRTRVGERFHAVNRRLDRVGAMGTAMAQMTANTSGLSGANRVGVGAGTYGGESALSVGFQRGFFSNSASVSIGAAFSGDESSVGIGAGFSW